MRSLVPLVVLVLMAASAAAAMEGGGGGGRSSSPPSSFRIERGGGVVDGTSTTTTTTTTTTTNAAEASASASAGGGGEGGEGGGMMMRRRPPPRTMPPNVVDPDYRPPYSTGGVPGHRGGHGLVVFVARGASTTATTPGSPSNYSPSSSSSYYNDNHMRATYVFEDDGYYDEYNARELPSNANAELESRRKTYVVPGTMGRAPYFRMVTIKAWGGGGGGCDGGRGETEERATTNDDDIVNDDEIANFGEGYGGNYVEATFLLPVGEVLRVFVGGGGGSSSSVPNSLGGRGGFGGGYPGRDDGSSGGGGGGGYSSVHLSNGTVLVSAYGGDGGGNASYCNAPGGRGGRLRGRQSTGRGGKEDEEDEDAGGYVNLDLALRSSSIDDRIVTCPGAPAIASLSHDSASFVWDAGACQRERSKELYVQKYAVRLSSASGDDVGRDSGGTTMACPDDVDEYRLLEHIQRGIDVNRNATTVATDLRPSTPYCLRIEAFSVRGLSLGVRILPFATKPEPINEWLPVIVRQLDVTVREAGVTMNDGDVSTTTAETSTTWCEHSSTRPSGRRGHSMTVIDDQVYIFGGATIKCVCKRQVIEREEMRACSRRAVYSNELWHFDPTTSLFTQLGWKSEEAEEAEEEEESPWPRGREQHSMTALPNGYLVLVGGVSSSNDDFAIGKEANVLLKDVWTMRDPRRVIPNLVFSSGNNAIDLIPGHVTSHVMPILLRDEVHGVSVGEEDMCINRLTVKFSFDRICTNGIQYIKLTGPGTATRGTADHDAPQSRDYETKVFVSSIESREKECQHSTSLDLLMSDDAEDWVLSHASIPKSGTFRPASSLASTFDGLPIDGEWKISISMEHPVFYPEESHGRLLDWELKIDAKPCAAGRPRWQKLPSPPSDFSQRRLHTAVAVGNSIFFTGGFAKHQLNDMWRFDFDTNSWTDLTQHAAVEHGRHLPLYGQASFLGPFGLLSYGGMAKRGTRNKGLDLFLLNLFEGDWVSVPIRQHDSAHDHGRFSDDIPHGRYLSKIGMLSNVDSIYKSYNVDGTGPMILAFGGDGALLHNTHADGYGFMSNSLFNDVWLLSPGGIGISGSSMNQQRRDHQCNWRWIPGSTAYRMWNSTCGADASQGDRPGPGECCLESILIAAWCQGQYQSF